jgi:hypothetical protein
MTGSGRAPLRRLGSANREGGRIEFPVVYRRRTSFRLFVVRVEAASGTWTSIVSVLEVMLIGR